ncbi:hypothetical protein SAMN04488577_2625 [Bacillus sp. cl95]|nr:hypothetical protein SAMN02799634_102505 [Bacillus sp. UNCCL13]SFQ85350.1 hypothetical protein SAMN04488577_2625 [Bacillus sp. cl95]
MKNQCVIFSQLNATITNKENDTYPDLSVTS